MIYMKILNIHDNLLKDTKIIILSIQEIIFYELPKLERRLDDFQSGRIEVETLTEEEKWRIYMRYRHEERAKGLIASLCREEEGIMRAEKSMVKVSRDYMRYVRKMAEIKNSMDRAEDLYKAQDEGRAEGDMAAKLEIARKMKNAGRPIDEITAFTGLPLETIEQIG